jgi:hypothetical protein
MPLTSYSPPLEVHFETPLDLKARAEVWFYRIGTYLLINLMDDPAWLALMFC